jgi:drug/metabolite transporter (DMT)-like permease
MNSLLLCLNVLAFTLLGACGGFFFKKTTKNTSLLGTIKSPYLYIGVGFYGCGAILNILVLKYLPYSVVLPITSITYIWTLILSFFFLKEKITKFKLGGVALIIVGALFIGLSTY